ncbi:MAG TPA: LuxR C-terminal-related transcriptional regulator [Candidatus Baltobacteraceae bacterium]|nr:LuxR C-terminal-related transcriptional regulator [Candidatus Baltobacteraceae bacterium]
MIRPVAADGRIETGGAFTPIVRMRVLERISQAAFQRVVLIVAPAGYGKSVALRQFLDTLADVPVARFDLRAEHRTLLGFLRGFSQAVESFAPDALKTVSGAYQKNAASSTAGADLAMWMHAHIKTFTGVIAIDDLQLAENEPEITRFLVSLIERTKGRVRWIISSRSVLDLPVGSWLAYGEMDLGIDEHDLGFTIEEAKQTAKASRVAVRDEELQQILTMTSGWPTAMSFALRSSTRSVDLRNITATTREMVYRYLAEQVYGSLGDEDRELLHLIAFLPEIDLEVLRHAGYNRAKALIEGLRDRVAFIYPERPNVYRAHDLFAAFLRNEVELQGDEVLRHTYVRAGRALEATGNIAAALERYAKSRSSDDVLRLLGEHGFGLIAQAQSDAVSAALESLDENERSDNALVLGLRALREAESGRLDRAQTLYERGIAASHDVRLKAELAVRLAVLLFDQQRFAVDLLEPYPEDPNLPLETRARALSMLIPCFAYLGRAREAFEAMTAAQKFYAVIDSQEVRAQLYHRCGIAALILDLPFETVQEYFGKAQELASGAGLFFTLAAALSGLETVALIYEDDLTKAAWLAQQSMNAALKAGARVSVQSALLQLAHIETRRGTPERLMALEKQFASTITSDIDRSWYIIPTRAILAAWDGRFEDAYRLLSSHRDRSTYKFDRVTHSALAAVYAFGANEREASRNAVSQTLELLNEGGFEGLHGARSAEIARVLCAVVETLSGRLTSAQRIMNQKMFAAGAVVEAARACASAVIRASKNPALTDEVTDALGGLQTAGAGGVALLVERLLSATSEKAHDPESPLTPAELEVFQGLADGLSPKEIAQQKGRSVYTVQAHIQNVIKKLGCSGRDQALSIARKNGLVKYQ